MEKKTFSTTGLALAGIIQAAFVARGSAVNPVLAVVWAIPGIAVLIESLWTVKVHTILKQLLAIVIISLIGGMLLWSYLTPNVRVVWSNQRPYLITDRHGTQWVKFGIYNNGNSTLICRAFITSLRKNQQTEYIITGESRMLDADSNGDPEISEGFAIVSGDERMFNLALLKQGDRQATIDSLSYRDLVSQSITEGEYIATVKASCKDSPVSLAQLLTPILQGSSSARCARLGMRGENSVGDRHRFVVFS